MKQKKRLDSWLEDHLPVGILVRRERRMMLVVLIGACVWAAMWYTLLYGGARQSLYIHVQGRLELAPQARMPDFVQIFPGTLTGFWLVIVLMPLKVWEYYAYHRKGSKSIYLMRRLGNPKELRRRCWTLPVYTAAMSLLLAAITTILCYLVYMKWTPAYAIVPGQWARFWSARIGG